MREWLRKIKPSNMTACTIRQRTPKVYWGDPDSKCFASNTFIFKLIIMHDAPMRAPKSQIVHAASALRLRDRRVQLRQLELCAAGGGGGSGRQ